MSTSLFPKLRIIWDSFAGTSQAILCSTKIDNYQELLESLISLSGSQTYVSLIQQRAEHFSLEPIPVATDSSLAAGQRPLYQSVDAREGITTGISAFDRACLIQILHTTKSEPRDLVRPGHIFPCVVHPGGVLAKVALPEAALDVAHQFGEEISVFHDILDTDGQSPSCSYLENLSTQYQIPMLSIADVIVSRLKNETLVQKQVEASVPLLHGEDVKLSVFTSPVLSGEHLTIVKGTITEGSVVPVRVQLENTLDDLFGGAEAVSKRNIDKSLVHFAEKKSGIFVYIRKPFLDTPTTQRNSMREYGIGAQILKSLGAKKIELLTSNINMSLDGLETFGIEVVKKTLIK